MDTAKS